MTKRPLSRLSGFTLIELIVVISIMAILSALIIAAVQGITGKAKEKKTGVIIRAVETGIYLAVASRGSAISPAEHPFAGSRGPRFPFVRANGGSALSSSGTALKGVPTVAYLSSGQNQLMLPSDIYAEDRISILYGAKREDIGVLQSLRKVITQYRQIPCPPTVDPLIQPTVTSTVSSTAGFDSPANDINWPDTMIPSTSLPPSGLSQETDPTFGTLADAKSALDYLFGSSSAQAELSSLKALYNADPTLPQDVNKFTFGIESRTVGGVTEPLVYTNAFTGGKGKDSDTYVVEKKWKPGFIAVTKGGTTATLAKTSSTWVRYRLPGLAVYDAWDNELFVTVGANDKYRVLSAGADGVLAVNPGKDNMINTTSLTGDMREKLPLTGDDTDGAKDNVK